LGRGSSYRTIQLSKNSFGKYIPTTEVVNPRLRTAEAFCAVGNNRYATSCQHPFFVFLIPLNP
jgi:hypothetical protein